MFDVEGYDSIRFDAIGTLPVDENGWIRMDKNCTPGKTIPCGNACRTPSNCKSKGSARVSEKGKDLRKNYANQIREQRGLKSIADVNSTRQMESAVFGKPLPKSNRGRGPQAMARKRSEAAQKAATTRATNQKKALTSTKRFGQATTAEASLVDNFMASQAKKKARSASAQKAAATRATRRSEKAINATLDQLSPEEYAELERSMGGGSPRRSRRKKTA